MRRWIVRNFQTLIVSAVKICKQCLQTASASGYPLPGLHPWTPLGIDFRRAEAIVSSMSVSGVATVYWLQFLDAVLRLSYIFMNKSGNKSSLVYDHVSYSRKKKTDSIGRKLDISRYEILYSGRFPLIRRIDSHQPRRRGFTLSWACCIIIADLSHCANSCDLPLLGFRSVLCQLSQAVFHVHRRSQYVATPGTVMLNPQSTTYWHLVQSKGETSSSGG